MGRTYQGGDVGILRPMFPEGRESQHEALVQISWDEFFRQFEEAEPALAYKPDSVFNELVGRDTAERRGHGAHR